MCGYAGAIWKNGITPFDVDRFLSCLEGALLHRGPDESGVKVGEGFAVVHRRLSIIDIADGHQPMISADGRVGIAYNGEIYNYKALRSEIESRGRRFHTNSDTEVFLALYEAEGEAAFARLDGMFTAFIWDYRSEAGGVFYLVRDQLGIKPLYLYEDGSQFIFSSELRPLLKVGDLDLEVNPYGVSSYLTYRYCHAPYTFYKHIRRIDAGTFVRIRRGQASTWRYWDLSLNENTCVLSLDDAASHLKCLLRESVARQQMSEVPVGILLSGGLDSSVISALCAEVGVSLLSFNIGFPDLNEFSYSEQVARQFNLPHITIETTPAEIARRFDRVVEAMDEPIADPACFPLHILCDRIKEHVTVVLSGEGSDEMLGGYPQYQRVLEHPVAPLWEMFDRFRDYSWYFNRHRMPLSQAIAPYKHWGHRQYFGERSMLNGMMAYDIKTWLPENLMAKADKILMSHSLEGRFPFLSTQIVDFCFSLPEHYKLDKSGGKMILRRAFGQILPQSVLTRPKMGFSVPVADIVRQMREQLYDLLDAEKTGALGNMWDHRALRADFDDHFSGRREQALWLWTVLVLLQWFNSMRNNSTALSRSTAQLSRATGQYYGVSAV